MVDFRFDIRPLFKESIMKVSFNLLPHDFKGDRKQAMDATAKVSEIIDRLGVLSAISQKLNTPVTSADRLRLAEHQTVYLLADVDVEPHGVVIGLLKVGIKNLYLFDGDEHTCKVENAPCILDFYVHESRQRTGIGKRMFDTMLQEEEWTPVKCCVDRPSEKLIAFLKRHYGLVKTIQQANNFVVYQGFFEHTPLARPGGAKDQRPQARLNGLNPQDSGPNSHLFGGHCSNDEAYSRTQRPQESSASWNNTYSGIAQIVSVGGRYGARRPACSMAENFLIW